MYALSNYYSLFLLSLKLPVNMKRITRYWYNIIIQVDFGWFLQKLVFRLPDLSDGFDSAPCSVTHT